MPNSITATGLETATQAELLAALTAQMQNIYGLDINVNPDSPDGQMLNIFVQSALDLLSFITNVNAMFDPDQAVGTILDQRVAINGLQRQGGTYTVTPVSITTTQALTLYGLDQTAQPVYTVQDSQGNQWQLQTTTYIGSAGTQNLNFQAANTGAITTILNTITTAVTIVLGVSVINNSVTYTTLGENEETDPALRIRRQQSVALSSQGYNNSLRAALLNINGVSSAVVHENDTNSTDVNGIPGHSIWVIVSGSAIDASIAQAIYSKRNAGCGMKGSQTYIITQADGSQFLILWDTVQEQNLFIAFVATSLNGIDPPNIAGIVAGLPTIFTPGVDAQVNINDLATLVQQIDPNTLVTGAGFSTSATGSFSNTLMPSALNYQFGVSSANIIVLPMILSPTLVTLAPLGTQTFTGLGGYGTLTYTLSVNNSGGSINSSSGLYTAGSTGSVSDTVLVTDSLGHTATATAVVT